MLFYLRIINVLSCVLIAFSEVKYIVTTNIKQWNWILIFSSYSYIHIELWISAQHLWCSVYSLIFYSCTHRHIHMQFESTKSLLGIIPFIPYSKANLIDAQTVQYITTLQCKMHIYIVYYIMGSIMHVYPFMPQIQCTLCIQVSLHLSMWHSKGLIVV